ncbi:MAG TPA: Rpn family recombination-promoting nuclease/putative transposase [Saprospiraceae bacterium]|nr:Rpn family recombination-promoting nuclease/putative transposase [Saprospiraceae bacterium]HMQ82970.1 Rpn family recombination-promoting nuclease/putative transposase [Saprospiraceae bacterium]
MPKNTPHDELFKATFTIESEVEAFLRTYLPEIGKHLDFTTLKLQSSNYISPDLREFFSDIVYSCCWKSENEAPQKGQSAVQVALLLEHKSYYPENIHIQLLRYLVETYQHQFHNSKKGLLQLTIPIVIYHGETDWSIRSFSEYVELPSPSLKKYLPLFDYELVDLKKIAKELIINQAIGFYLRSTFLLFKHKNDKRFLKLFSREIFTFVVQQELNEDQKQHFLRQLVTYIFKNYRFDKKEFFDYTKKLPTMIETTANSFYETIWEEATRKGQEYGMAQGFEEGLEKGLEQGLEQGLEKGRLITSLLDHILLLGRMKEKNKLLDLMLDISGLPLAFVAQFTEHYTSDNFQRLVAQIERSNQLPDLEETRDHLSTALLQYGFQVETITAYFQRK